MEMEPYSIYYYKRPVRIAFLIDPAGDQTWVDRIIRYNRDKWGGRFNPIIHSDGNSIKDVWWQFLKEYDPDIVYSTINLSEDLRIRISSEICPFSIEVSPPDDNYIHIKDHPIATFPTRKNVASVAGSFYDEESCLVLFEVDNDTPKPIIEFLSRNFRIINSNQSTPYPIIRSFRDCKTQVFKVSDFESLNLSLTDLADQSKRFVFPSQICSIPNDHKEISSYPKKEYFSVIVGDSINDLTFFWNRPLSLKKWLRSQITELWLSREMTENEIVRPGLTQFIHRYISLSGSPDQNEARFISFSFSSSEIQEISSKYTENVWIRVTFEKLDTPVIPNYDSYESGYFIKSGSESHWAHSKVEHLTLGEPEVENASIQNECWIADIYIQYKPEKFVSMVGIKFWWHLPKVNNLLNNLYLFDKPARINAQGSASILVRRKSEYSPYEHILKISIPDDRSVFHSLFCGVRPYKSKDTAGERISSRPFYYMQASDKGRYLRGVLDLFPDLSSAHMLFEKRFWRNIFKKLSDRFSKKEDERLNIVCDTLKKAIDKGKDFKNNDDDLTWLAERVLLEANQMRRQEVDLRFDDFRRDAEAETDEYNEMNTKNKTEFDEKGLKDGLHNLLELKILLIGIKPFCPRCGYRIWYHLEEVAQQITCRGCGYTFTVKPEEPWHYRLNSLARAALSQHGIEPLILILGQLLMDSNSSFLFVPNVELYEQFSGDPRDADPKYEVDIACIKDGKFIIGEVKENVSHFKEKDFIKIEAVAERVNPDVIIFSSLDIKPTPFVEQKIAEMNGRLAEKGIEVRWEQIHSNVFDPFPVR